MSLLGAKLPRGSDEAIASPAAAELPAPAVSSDALKASRAAAMPARERIKNTAAEGIKAETLAEICKVSLATAHRWKAGGSEMPHAAAALVSGDLGAFSKSWQGWKIRADNIISPEGWEISRDSALASPLLIGQVAALQAERQRLRYIGANALQPELATLLQTLGQELQAMATKLADATAAIADACTASNPAISSSQSEQARAGCGSSLPSQVVISYKAC